MRLLDHTLRAARWHALLGLWLTLFLSLVSSTAQASTVTRLEAMPMAVAAMSPDSMPIPMVMDCTPCIRCYVAPVPVAQGFGGEGKEAKAPHWQVHATTQVETAWAFDTGVWHPRLPVRIEFSRWLN